jgi:aminobenzoyl-glutamate utilization protein B
VNTLEFKQAAVDWIDSNKDEFYQAADALWIFPELGMEEHKSSSILIELLEKNGFTVEKGVAEMPTAFVATYGKGKPIIGFNSEYDCLPGLSQEVGSEKKPVIKGAPGQGCGHNLLGVAAIKAAIAIKRLLEANKITATLKVFGTPAEELCIGKPFMAKAGLFRGLDVVLDWHPYFYNGANYETNPAYFSIKYHFQGRTAHGNSPWYGRSTLDAAMLQAHAVEMLREHIPPSPSVDAAHTINYTFPDVGPEFPNVVPDRTTAWYIGRFTSPELMTDVMSRINKCAEAAAMATDTSVKAELISATHDRIPNKVLAEVMYKNLKEVNVPQFTEEEINFAKQMQKNVGTAENGLDETVLPFSSGSASVTDSSEYSWFAPYSMLWVASAPSGVGWHNWIITSCVGSSIGKKAMEVAAKVLAVTAIELIMNPDTIIAAQLELQERLAGREFIQLIPDAVPPPLSINTANMNKYR